MSDKFKAGDRLMKVRGNAGDEIKVGDVVEVVSAYDYVGMLYVRTSTGKCWQSDSFKYEYEDIANSPLYKALS